MRTGVTHCTAWLLALAGCGSGSGEIGDAMGPGRIAGNIVFREPGIEVNYTAPDAPAAARGELQIPLDFGIVAPGQVQHTRTLSRELWKLGQLDSYGGHRIAYDGNGSYRMPFDFSGIPLAAYSLGYTHHTGTDWGMTPGLEFETRQEVPLSKHKPEALAVEHVIPGGSGSGSAAGGGLVCKLLINGNGIDTTLVPGFGNPAPVPVDGFSYVNMVTQLLVDVAPTPYGRYFITMNDLAPGTHQSGQWDSIPSQYKNVYWTDEEDADDNSHQHPYTFEIVAGQQTQGGRAYDYRGWYLEDGTQEANQDQFGVLEVSLTIGNSLERSGDILLLAENTDGDLNGNGSAWNYVVPEHFDGEGIAHYRLTYLRAGTYTLSLIQLGPTNSDPVVRLAEYPEPVTLPSGQPYPDFNWGMDDVPYAAVDFHGSYPSVLKPGALPFLLPRTKAYRP